jgi:hypothetical protein
MNDSPGLESSASFKTHLSRYFAASAALFSRKAYAIEALDPTVVTDVVRIEHRAYAIGAVVGAATYLEAAINELYLVAIDRNKNIFSSERLRLAELMSHVWADVEQLSVLAKYQVALTLAESARYPKGQEPYQAVDGLLKLRNALVHYKPEWNTELEEHRGLELRLANRFPESKLSLSGQTFLPDRCLGHGCAAWATKAAVAFHRDFIGRLGLNVPPVDPAVLATE